MGPELKNINITQIGTNKTGKEIDWYKTHIVVCVIHHLLLIAIYAIFLGGNFSPFEKLDIFSSGDIAEKVVLCTFVSDTPPPARLDARHEMIQQDMKFCTIINGPCQVAIIYFPLQHVFLLSTRLFLKKYTFVNISRGCLHFKQADVYWVSSGCVDNFWLSIISIICPTLLVYHPSLH